MSFVAKHIVGNDERLIGVARLHGIYLIAGILWALFALSIGYGLNIVFYYLRGEDVFTIPISFIGYSLGTQGDWVQVIFGILALALFMIYVIKTLFTEVALTNKRVIYKTGFLAVEVHEIDLHEIDAANIHHGPFGALLGYGTVYLDCRFVGDVRLPAVKNPYRFLQALHRAKASLTTPPLPPKPAA